MAAFFLCELRVAFAFFAFTILFENAKVATRNPAKTAKVCISNFKFKSEILDGTPIRAFLADPKFLRLAAGVVPVRDA